jgi:CheY-like chemotaxis protein
MWGSVCRMVIPLSAALEPGWAPSRAWPRCGTCILSRGKALPCWPRVVHRAGRTPAVRSPRRSAPAPLAVGVVCVPYPGETVCGDAWMVAQQEERCLVLVVDGLGHGPAAADAARAVVQACRQHSTRTPEELLAAAHTAAQGTRGAAVGLAEINTATQRLHFAGVGNIAGVDDEPVIANALARLLRRDGRTVDTAANGSLALMKLQERAYDLILSDLRMPELDGSGLYRALETRYPQLCQRFIFLTGDTLNPDTHALSVQHGVPQLFKPYTAAELRRVIRQVLQAG